MKLPPWLKPLTARDERLRAAHGLTAKRDGWYKSIDGETRYVCKPCPVPDAAALLPARIQAIRDKAKGQATPPTVRVTPGLLSVEALAEAFIKWLYQRLTTGVPKKLARRTYDDYVAVLASGVRSSTWTPSPTGPRRGAAKRAC
jgi:hypothetical protein